MRVLGDHASFYNCKFYGFQDTLCDDAGKHFFKDCYIEGTFDFIFGSGTSLYLVKPNSSPAFFHVHDKRNVARSKVITKCLHYMIILYVSLLIVIIYY